MEQTLTSQVAREVQRRRTFAIISHPDAGKTTLTEKLLLYAGAVRLAGSVRTRKGQRHATSDWMEMEQERGISITSAVMQFDYRDYHINLLDTPGHQDFSEDTYRVLTAVDNAVMVIDSANGVESQTRKLFEVCQRRRTPVFTLINKVDRPGKEPLELLGEIEDVLGIATVPMNWPVRSMLGAVVGIYDLQQRQVHLFERAEHGSQRAPVQVTDLHDPVLAELLEPQALAQLRDEVELLEAAGDALDRDRVQSGELTPVYFASALLNFGVQLFLDSFLDLAVGPVARKAQQGLVRPEHPHFSGFVFKLQANMDRRHRDRLAFVRVCSGRFERDMVVNHVRTGKKLRLTRSLKLFAQERESVDEAYPGDIVGLINPGMLAIGDTLCSSERVEFDEIPRFPPEHFATLSLPETDQRKALAKGLDQLCEEGLVQVFYPVGDVMRQPILAAVGPLQFDVLTDRLENEYNVQARVERLPYEHARWLEGTAAAIAAMRCPPGCARVLDPEERPVLLLPDDWSVRYTTEKNPEVTLHRMPPKAND
ncbi:MAG: peptide chain release factor 3 [Armatimonadetes bacterium]|nr:peptide chain release factor 3 [Armatimonadota bacterium]